MNTKQKKNSSVNETVLDNQIEDVSTVDVNAADNQDADTGAIVKDVEPDVSPELKSVSEKN